MEPTPITWQPGGEGVGVFNITGAPKLEKGADTRRTWKCEIVTEVASAEIAGQLHLFHEDTRNYWVDAEEEEVRTRVLRDPLKDHQLVVSLTSGSGAGIQKLRVELGQVKTDFNTNRKVQVSRLVVRGLGVGDSNTLVDLQGRLVRVAVHVQVTERKGLDPEVGQVVSGTTSSGAVVVGRMTGTDPDTDAVLLDDFGATYEVSSVVSAYTLESTTAQDVDQHLELYRNQVIADAGEWSWASIVEAAFDAAKAGEVQRPSGSTLYINPAVVQRAIDASRLPAEAAGG